MKSIWSRSLVAAFLAVVGVLAALLTFLLSRVTPGSFGIGNWIEAFVAMTWIAFATNAVFAILVLIAWGLRAAVASAERRIRLRESFGATFVGGLVALNVVWCLWNRLAMANSFASGKRRFLTTSSLIELAALGVVLVGIVAAFVGFSGGRSKRLAPLGLLFALTAGAGVYALGVKQESFHRRVTHAEVLAAATANPTEWPVEVSDDDAAEETGPALPADEEGIPVPTTAAGRRVIAIGADGIDWSVLTPLMRAGRLPALSRFVENGAFGYLDNGDESYSPVIWTTMFTGMPGRVHGVYDFQKAVLPRTRKGLPNPLLMPPTIDSFYGLKSLLGSRELQAPGLWHMAWVGARDRRVPTVWDIASHYEKRVAICDALANQPAREINGAILNLGKLKGEGAGAFHPPELHGRWKEARDPDPEFEKTPDGRFQALSARFDNEVGFALDTLEEFGTDFCFYYTYFVDSQCHSDWAFYAEDRYFLSALPSSLDDEEWEAFVLEHEEERAIRSYMVLDAQLARFQARFPDALFVIVSDHGWTFSGYEHFNSPEGVVLISGPGVDVGRELTDVHIEDVAPTLLALLGVPLSRHLPGRVVEEAFTFELTTEEVSDYRHVDLTFGTDAGVVVSEEEEQRLRDIGYVR